MYLSSSLSSSLRVSSCMPACPLASIFASLPLSSVSSPVSTFICMSISLPCSNLFPSRHVSAVLDMNLFPSWCKTPPASLSLCRRSVHLCDPACVHVCYSIHKHLSSYFCLPVCLLVGLYNALLHCSSAHKLTSPSIALFPKLYPSILHACLPAATLLAFPCPCRHTVSPSSACSRSFSPSLPKA